MGWATLLPVMWPLLISGLAELFGVLIAPKPVALPPKSSVSPLAAVSVPELEPLPRLTSAPLSKVASFASLSVTELAATVRVPSV